MRAQLWVESHQPVPLVPLSMLKIEPGDVIYIGEHVEKGGETKWGRFEAPPGGPVGWFQAGPNGLFVSLDSADYWWDQWTDYEHSMGRRLQAGESVLVRYTSR